MIFIQWWIHNIKVIFFQQLDKQYKRNIIQNITTGLLKVSTYLNQFPI